MKILIAALAALVLAGTALGASDLSAVFDQKTQPSHNDEHIQVFAVPRADSAGNTVRCIVASNIGVGYGSGSGIAISCDWS